MSGKRHWHYTSVDKRTYNCEPNLAPRDKQPSRINLLLVRDAVSAADVYRIELFLENQESGRTFSNVILPKKERSRVVSEYGLTKTSNNRWQGDEEKIFLKFCERWATAEKYKTYKNLLYAVRYGSAPVTIIQPAKTTGKD